jgi:hypothetical protein
LQTAAVCVCVCSSPNCGSSGKFFFFCAH